MTHFGDQSEHHTPAPEGTSAQVETSEVGSYASVFAVR